MAYISTEENKNLPVCNCKSRIIEEAKNNKSLLIISETGSGKTTKIPQYLLSIIEGNDKIVCTQPRRIAAISIAKRVSEELRCRVGDRVGYMVRFDDNVGNKTKLIYATDGSLLRESIEDPKLLKYSIIILDEAHERSLHTDILFGVVKNAQILRENNNEKPLKIVVMSATISVDKFSTYFNSKVLYIEGREYPVKILYTKTHTPDYFNAIFRTILTIHKNEPMGNDILVFLTGQEEIENMQTLLNDHEIKLNSFHSKLIVLTLFSALPLDHQLRAFNSTPGHRKVILSTNISETSITIPGIKYVIDSGVVKMKTFDPSTGLVQLKINNISRAQARQRAGRAGRLGSGICYRIYTEDMFYDTFSEETIPELTRSNLSSIILNLLILKINENFENFDWLDKPDKSLIDSAIKELYYIDAVSSDNNDCEMTKIGVIMAHLPVEPKFARALISASKDYNCSVEMVTLVALLSEKNLFYTPTGERGEVISRARTKFISSTGDLITLLNIWKAYMAIRNSSKQQQKQQKQQNQQNQQNQQQSKEAFNYLKGWCDDHGFNYRSLQNIKKARQQLLTKLKYLNLPIISAESKYHDNKLLSECIIRALLTGFFMNTAILEPDNRSYRTLFEREEVTIHPTSFLYASKHECVIFIERIKTSKNYIRYVTTFYKEWLSSVSMNTTLKKDLVNRLNLSNRYSVVYS